jgi:glutathione S-transferase
MGLGWCRRLQTIHAGMQLDPPSPMARFLGPKYGYTEEDAAEAPGRVVEVLKLLRDRLYGQRAAGHRYLMGDQLSALDIYWATFCNLLAPLPPEKLPMPEPLRPIFTATDGDVKALLEGGLLEHRDFVYEEHLVLPVPL